MNVERGIDRELLWKGNNGVVCSAYDTHVGEKVSIKTIDDVFEHICDATFFVKSSYFDSYVIET